MKCSLLRSITLYLMKRGEGIISVKCRQDYQRNGSSAKGTRQDYQELQLQGGLKVGSLHFFTTKQTRQDYQELQRQGY